MKTVVIWDTLEGEIKFFVVNGDFSHLDGVYINSMENELGQDELNKILDYDSNGNPKVTMLEHFPKEDVINGANVIVAGFFP